MKRRTPSSSANAWLIDRKPSLKLASALSEQKVPAQTQLDNGNLCIVVPMLIKRMRGRKAIILPGGQPTTSGEFSEAVQLPRTKAVALAFAWTEALESGRYVDITALATALEVDSAYIRRILDLANLSPALVEAIFRGEEPDGLSLARLRKGFPETWCEQEAALRFALEQGTAHVAEHHATPSNSLMFKIE